MQFSNVDAGGYTVFTEIGAKVPPVKVSVIFPVMCYYLVDKMVNSGISQRWSSILVIMSYENKEKKANLGNNLSSLRYPSF